MPKAFTEHGITKLASVLRSDTAIKMNIEFDPLNEVNNFKFYSFFWNLLISIVINTEMNRNDPKTKKEKEVCKTIKVHKKLEGTTIPAKK